MKKAFRKDERRRPTSSRKNASHKPSASHSSVGHSNAPRRLKNKLYICGLLPTVLREELIREFGKFGKLHDVWVAKKPPGFAFVEYINSRDAERVVHELDDTKVLGSKVRIEFAKANKGFDEGKKPKKFFSIGSAVSPSGGKLLNSTTGKPAIAPLMGQLVVPSLLTAGLGSSLSLLGSPPMASLALSSSAQSSGMVGPMFKRNRSERSKKRLRADSGGYGDRALSKNLISPGPRRYSRSPGARERMLSPPHKRSLIAPSPPFSRLSRGSRRLPPPPISRELNMGSIPKLPRPPGLIPEKFPRSPIRMRSSSYGRTRRSPLRDWARSKNVSPARNRFVAIDKMQSFVSPVRSARAVSPADSRSFGRARKRSLSHERKRSVSHRKNAVKSQVKTVTGPRRSCSQSCRNSREKRKLSHRSPSGSGSRRGGSEEPYSQSEINRKNFKRSSTSTSSRSRSRNLDNHKKSADIGKRSSRGRSPRRLSNSRNDDSFDRRASHSSHRVGSVSLRRNFRRSSRECSRNRSPPLNIPRTRFLGRTPPSPPTRNSKPPEKIGPVSPGLRKSPSVSPARNEHETSRSRSYVSRHSLSRSLPVVSRRQNQRNRSASSGSYVKNSKPRLATQNDSSSSSSSSRSSTKSSSRAGSPDEKMKKGPELKKARDSKDSSRESNKVKKNFKRSSQRQSPSPDLSKHKISSQKRASRSPSSEIKKPALKSYGGPRSPSCSPDSYVAKRFEGKSTPTRASPVNRSGSSKSKVSDKHSSARSGSGPTSLGRKTPLAYQHRRESLSPQRKNLNYSRSRSPRVKTSRRSFSVRNSHAKTQFDHRDRDFSTKYGHRGVSPPPPLMSDRFKREYRRSPSYQDHQRLSVRRYYRSPPPPLAHETSRHYGMLEEEMAMRVERSRPLHCDEPRYYRRGEYPLEPERAYYRRPSPLPPPPPPVSYSYRRIPDIPYQRSSRIRGEEIDPYYRSTEPYRGRIRNPPIIYRSDSASVYPRQRPYRR